MKKILLQTCCIAIFLFTSPSLSLAQISDSLRIPQWNDFPSRLDQIKYNSSSIFTEYWHNTHIFPYSSAQKSPMPDTIFMTLIDGLHKFVMPCKGRLNSGFGWRGKVFHKGLDINLRKGDKVKAAFDGKVRYSKFNDGGYGNLIIIRHLNGLETYYSHLTKIKVKPNQIVKAGDCIGTGGNTGARWTGDHLHFEMRYMDIAFNPVLAINLDVFDLISDTLILTKKDLSAYRKVRTVRNRKKVKKPENIATGENYYIIKKGDSLSKIARKNYTSVDALCQMNNLNRNSILKIGKSIRVQ